MFGAQVVRGPVDVAVERPTVDNASSGHRLVADAERAILRVDGVAAFGVDRGERVVVEADPHAEPDRVAEYLTSIVATLVLGQQRRFALHANAVSVDGSALLFAGDRGVGKSTASLRLLQRGHAHLTDDQCLLHPAGERLVLDPTPRGIRFLAETARALQLDVTAAIPSPAAEDKMVLPQPPATPAPVRAIVVLEPVQAAGVEVRRLGAVEALEMMTRHAYRRAIVQLLWPRELFAWTADIVERVPVHELRRPASGWSVDQVADALERVARSDAA